MNTEKATQVANQLNAAPTPNRTLTTKYKAKWTTPLISNFPLGFLEIGLQPRFSECLTLGGTLREALAMKRTLSIVIPVYNEALRLTKTFQALEADLGCKAFILKEVVFVDDGSTDGTLSMITAYGRQHRFVRIVSYAQNRGKGYAVKQGLVKAQGDYALIADADMSTPFGELEKMVHWVKDGVPVVIGTRKNSHSTVVIPQPLYRQILGRGFTLLAQLALNVWVTDFTCGFKLLSRDAYQEIGRAMKIERWSYDAEMVYLAKKFDYKVHETPVKWYNDKRSKVHVVVDVINSLKDLWAIRLNDLNGTYENEVPRVTLVERVFSWLKIVWQ